MTIHTNQLALGDFRGDERKRTSPADHVGDTGDLVVLRQVVEMKKGARCGGREAPCAIAATADRQLAFVDVLVQAPADRTGAALALLRQLLVFALGLSAVALAALDRARALFVFARLDRGQLRIVARAPHALVRAVLGGARRVRKHQLARVRDGLMAARTSVVGRCQQLAPDRQRMFAQQLMALLMALPITQSFDPTALARLSVGRLVIRRQKH